MIESKQPVSINRCTHSLKTEPLPGSGTWQDANTSVMTWRFIETAHYDTVTCRFGDDSMAVNFEGSRAKINKTKDPRPALDGKLQAEAVGVKG